MYLRLPGVALLLIFLENIYFSRCWQKTTLSSKYVLAKSCKVGSIHHHKFAHAVFSYGCVDTGVLVKHWSLISLIGDRWSDTLFCFSVYLPSVATERKASPTSGNCSQRRPCVWIRIMVFHVFTKITKTLVFNGFVILLKTQKPSKIKVSSFSVKHENPCFLMVFRFRLDFDHPYRTGPHRPTTSIIRYPGIPPFSGRPVSKI